MFKKHTINAGILLFTLIYCSAGVAAGARFAFIDAKKALFDSNSKKQADARLDKEFGNEEKKIKADAKKLAEMAEALKKVNKKTDDATFKMQREYVKLRRSHLRQKQDFTIRVRKKQVMEHKKLQKKLMSAIETIAKKEKYDVVLAQKGMLVYSSPAVDITAKVTALLNK